MAGERCVATPQVDAHLSVKPGYGLSLSQTPEATGWLGRDLLLLKALSFRLEHERPYFNANLQLYAEQAVLEEDIFQKIFLLKYDLACSKKRELTLAALSLSSKRRVTKSSKR